MNIEVIKDKIEELYVKSLKVDVSIKKHPLVLLNSCKSLIGLNLGKPIVGLFDYTESYIDNNKIQNKQIDVQGDVDPGFVSYKQLNESLLNKDKEKSYNNIHNLLKVSDGMQTIEYLLEFSLKYSLKSFIFIWSVYKMSLFFKQKYILEALLKCVEYIIESGMQDAVIISDIQIDGGYLNKMMPKKDSFIEFYFLYTINFEKLVRQNKIKELVASNLVLRSTNREEYKESANAIYLNSLDRTFLHEYLTSLKLEDFNYDMILTIDSIRSAMKVCEENNISNIFIWNEFKNKFKIKNENK